MLRERDRGKHSTNLIVQCVADHRKGRFHSHDTHATEKTSKNELTGFVSRASFQEGFQCDRAESPSHPFSMREKSSRHVGLGFYFGRCFFFRFGTFELEILNLENNTRRTLKRRG